MLSFDVCFFTLQVVVTQMNGVNYASESIHVLHVGKMRIKLCKGKTTLAKEYYSTLMQVIAKFKSFLFYLFFFLLKKGPRMVLHLPPTLILYMLLFKRTM